VSEERVLEVSKLTAGYGGPPVISAVTIEAKRGAITAIVGPNGAGKSTLLKAIAGLIRPTEGSVKVNGADVTGLPAEKLVSKGLAYVPQVANVFPELTIRENLDMGGYSRKAGVGERIDQLFKLFPDLAASSSRKAHTLSGGQRTMLALAVLVIEQNTRETLRHAQWAYVLVLGQNRLEGPGKDLLDDEEVVNLYVGRLS
jgi:ABC-type branched-subunit amino acid transport system ATPase component